MSKKSYSPFFLIAFEHVLKHEGGYVDDPSDNGGATKYGISLRFYKAEVDKNATKETIKNLDVHEAEAIYHQYFWVRYSYGFLPYEIGIKMFDMAVNMGGRRAGKLLQKAVNQLLEPALKVKVDGIIGSKTRSAINCVLVDQLLECLREEQRKFYKAIVKKNPTQARFLKGWLKRADF